MGNFNFQMQKLLDIKEKSREQEEWNYAKLIKLLEDENDKLHVLLEHKDELQLKVSNEQSKGLSVNELHQSQMYIQHLSHLIDVHEKSLQSIENQMSVKREEIIALKMEEKKFVKLREKKWVEYVNENNYKEQKATDEIALHHMHR